MLVFCRTPSQFFGSSRRDAIPSVRGRLCLETDARTATGATARTCTPSELPVHQFYLIFNSLSNMKHFTMKAFGLLAMLFAFGWVQAQNSEAPQANPQTEWSTNPAGYDAAKTDWVASHPQEYKAMHGETAKAIEVKTNPWGEDANKEAWIAAHPREYAAMSVTPADTRIRMTKEEFKAFPPAKQEAIKQDANFIIEE